MAISDDVRLMARPFAVYRELGAGDEPAPIRAAIEKAGLLLLTLGAFVSLTSAGRLVAFHVASPFVFYLFVPVLQAAGVAAAMRAVAPTIPIRKAISLYFSGLAPWKLFLLGMALFPLVTSDTYISFTWLVRKGILPVAMLATIGWSVLLTFACFRAGVGLTRGKAILATVIHYLVFAGSIVGYYLAMNQIQPQLPGIP